MYKKAFEKLENFDIENYKNYSFRDFQQHKYTLKNLTKKSNNIFIGKCNRNIVFSLPFLQSYDAYFKVDYMIIVKEQNFYYRFRGFFDNTVDAIDRFY